jgi:hypothetical protein
MGDVSLNGDASELVSITSWPALIGEQRYYARADCSFYRQKGAHFCFIFSQYSAPAAAVKPWPVARGGTRYRFLYCRE